MVLAGDVWAGLYQSSSS